MAQLRWDALKVGNVLVHLHHQLAVLCRSRLLIDGGVFSQRLRWHRTCGCSALISQVYTIIRRERLAYGRVWLNRIQSLSCWLEPLGLGSGPLVRCGPITVAVLWRTRVSSGVIEGIVVALLVDVHLAFDLVCCHSVLNTTLGIILF